MDRELRRLQNEAKQITDEASEHLSGAVMINQQVLDHLEQVRDEYWRVNRLSGQAGEVLNSIDRDFAAKTKLDKTDVILLFLCTALQCTRQYLFNNKAFRISHTQGDELMENTVGRAVGLIKPEWNKVLFQSVPYDAITRSPNFTQGTGLSGATHRSRALGHDPVLGWIFGTANIMTRSLTKYNFETYQVSEHNVILRHYPSGVGGMMNRAVQYSSSDPKLLMASVARQAIHFGSDVFTDQGLPLPLITTVNNDLAQKMVADWHIDVYSVTRGVVMAAFVNRLITCIHGLFYNEARDGSHSFYEIRTRRIVSYSNLLATGSNVLVTAFTGDVSRLDVGGILVTIYRLVSDYKFINEIKRDFLQNEFYKQVVGNQYDFMEGE